MAARCFSHRCRLGAPPMMGQPSPGFGLQGQGIPSDGGRLLQPEQASGQTAPKITQYDLSEGDYTVTVSIGQSSASQKDANAAVLSTLMEAAPDLTPGVIDIYAEQLDGPIGPRLVKRFQKLNPQLTDDKEGGPPPIPLEVQQQMQQLQEQVQQMGQALQQEQQKAAISEAKVQAQIQMKQMELASRERIAAMQINADLTKTKATVESKESIASLDADITREGHDTAHMHEERMKHLDQAHDEHASIRDAVLAPAPGPSKTRPTEFTPPPDQVW